MSIKILLAEDHTLVRSGIRSLLEASSDVEVIGEAGDGRVAIDLCDQLQPNLVLMDVAMPGLNGIEATRKIRANHPNMRVIMLSMHGDRQYVYESLKAGAGGYLLKAAAFTDLLAAIRAVMAGKTYLSPPLSDVVMDDYVRRAQGDLQGSELEKLSAREREVLQLISEGNSSAAVADLLHISVRTVDTHRHNIMEKLNIHSIAGLTRFAIRHGLGSLH